MALPDVPRTWVGVGLHGIFEPGLTTYAPIELDPGLPAGLDIDSTLSWLLEEPIRDPSLQRGRWDTPERDADATGLAALALSVPPPEAFRRFIEDPEPRRHIRSATSSYLDLAHFAISMSDGGVLVHFLSDQQWVLHWLLYAGPDGSEAVVVSPEPFGFDDGHTPPVRSLDVAAAADRMVVCAETFEEFLFRSWAENELFFRLDVDHASVDSLPPRLRAHVLAYPPLPEQPAVSWSSRILRTLRRGRPS